MKMQVSFPFSLNRNTGQYRFPASYPSESRKIQVCGLILQSSELPTPPQLLRSSATGLPNCPTGLRTLQYED